MNPEIKRALAEVMKGQKWQDVAKAHGYTSDSDEYKELRALARKAFENSREPIKRVSVSMDPRVAAKADDGAAVSDSDKPGRLVAVFSTFNVMDSDGDVVASGAVHEEQDVPFTFAHDWTKPSLGKGDVKVELDRAVWDGYLFVEDMPSAAETFASIKNMGARQEYSWSFLIKDAEIEEDDSAPWGFKRIIKDTEMIEVCGAIRGVNRQTYTLLAKSDTTVTQDNANLFQVAFDAALAFLAEQDEPTESGGEPEKGTRLEDQINDVQVALADLMERVSSLAETRAAEGRSIGKANLGLLADLAATCDKAATAFAYPGAESEEKSDAGPSKEALELYRDAMALLHHLPSQ